jgi:hypothetical protein
MVLPDPHRSRAVLLGTSRFTHPGLPDLPAVRNNLEGLAACFQDPGLWGLPAACCTVVADPVSPGDLIDPVHEAAEAAEDTLLVYYAGHGLIDHDTNELLLALVGSVSGRSHTAARYEYLRRDVNNARARRRVVILDCCYSGKAVGGMADPATMLADEASAEGIYLLASAPANKQALSPPGEPNTAFTGALLTVLTGGLPDAGPELRLDEIYRHVFYSLRGRSRPEPQRRAGNTAGDLALVRNRGWQRAPGAAPISLPAIRPSTPTQPRRIAIRERIKELVRDQGAAESFRCPVCQVTVKGESLIRHFDKHGPAESASLDPATLSLDIPPVFRRPRLVAERYQLDALIGSSRTVKVWRATDIRTGTTVAVKQQPADPDLLRAAQAAAALDHPLIVKVLDTLETTTRSGRPLHWIVTEYVDGPSLRDGPPPAVRAQPRWSEHIVAAVCDALDAGHRQGFVHGDVVPRNVIVHHSGPKLINFGLSGVHTPADRKADIRGAAQLLTHLLMHDKLIPPNLAEIVRKALDDQYPTAADLRDALSRP